MLVGIDMLVHSLRADRGKTTNLLWTPLLQQPLLGELPCGINYRPRILRVPSNYLAVCLLRAIAVLATVTR